MLELKNLVESLDNKSNIFETSKDLADVISMGEWGEFCYKTEN